MNVCNLTGADAAKQKELCSTALWTRSAILSPFFSFFSFFLLSFKKKRIRICEICVTYVHIHSFFTLCMFISWPCYVQCKIVTFPCLLSHNSVKQVPRMFIFFHSFCVYLSWPLHASMLVLKKSRIARNVDQIIIESDQCRLFGRSRRAFVARCGKPLKCTLYYESLGRASPPT